MPQRQDEPALSKQERSTPGQWLFFERRRVLNAIDLSGLDGQPSTHLAQLVQPSKPAMLRGSRHHGQTATQLVLQAAGSQLRLVHTTVRVRGVRSSTNTVPTTRRTRT